MNKKHWLVYALVTTFFWGIWGAFSEIPEKNGFPGTLIYVVWAISMIIPALFALKQSGWKVEHDGKSIYYGLLIGFLGAGGQLALLSKAIVTGPAYLIFPIISLSPVVTIILSTLLLKERAGWKGWTGIILAIIAIPLLSYQAPADGPANYSWLFYALLVFLAWGLQAFYMRKANKTMRAESIFFYMTVTGLILAAAALLMTDFSSEINWGFNGPGMAFLIQLLNSVGALTIVYAFRYGKAIIVSPLTNAVAPVITIIISLLLYAVFPNNIVLSGMILALISMLILSFDGED
jgi:uncharacterized membrane protein